MPIVVRVGVPDTRNRKGQAMNAQEARDLGYYFEWQDDWGVGSHIEEYGEPAYTKEPRTCEVCLLFNPSGEVVASVGCVDDADEAYRASIEDELAAEATNA